MPAQDVRLEVRRPGRGIGFGVLVHRVPGLPQLWEWHSAAADTPDQLYALWEEAVARSRANVRKVLAPEGLDALARHRRPDGRAPSLRRILVDLIEEYARHVGHADLIRESVDGRVGEDPPR
jgi:hypothetical protein